jgi:hypothetical protein
MKSSWLFIDTSSRERIRIALIEKEQNTEWITEGSRQSLLLRLSEYISPKRLSGLSGICVVRGPGSFSSIRSGVLIANLLSRMYRLPLFGVDIDQSRDLSVLRTNLLTHTILSVTYVAPMYDAEPNITCPSIT